MDILHTVAQRSLTLITTCDITSEFYCPRAGGRAKCYSAPSSQSYDPTCDEEGYSQFVRTVERLCEPVALVEEARHLERVHLDVRLLRQRCQLPEQHAERPLQAGTEHSVTHSPTRQTDRPTGVRR